MPVKIDDVLRNHAKEKLRRGEVVASMTVRLVHGIEIARIAKTAGFDSLYVDMEHSSFSLETTGQICMAALAAGVTPLVRSRASPRCHGCSTAARLALSPRMSDRRRRRANT
jgi:4-hydroxy-2-oxoheptanedioate aldolase